MSTKILDPRSIDLDEDLLRASDLAKFLNTTEGALAQLRFKSEGPRFVKVGRSVRYRRIDVQQYIASHLSAPMSAHARLAP